jgi:hypothetical protein
MVRSTYVLFHNVPWCTLKNYIDWHLTLANKSFRLEG